ncbi:MULTISPECIES: tRNA (adenosine(37)-N6)-dimethylallyltransferase MiaA [Dictyoglomus]|jgi:tRNA dimethylallyltransferase|uniref:tRNA dimethylallyltransferase n=1 Tax=Dictyoglomus turgidum (strain DSM 6724 / Z-1310) TaxID=515635 RepID=MIAA_DICTD|nr:MULTISPECIES: tRNA (adenosine(37)-N6)-dimethylallyltransferase MiaA [Dictyoglomus]B8E281.1 RecName: Full=tRNA dimethylallyltransferase; AltName: Full=Dimethylallyl diphosphate:tRNA dimethylallyltransferase; Short=DMAPP:tRNA dimethylallyltransferase; Short=DMATase; AltName: Full=Isopentenyl-diphosphate:tRNA isopentenyltransferase; Short=IPP transferase; Short=IPPT; Short=IPTase [Dictyoglomus turgidum DSM 6724]ACK42358.1 tRNA delta(2)-isopentenylpyrophosphate transferase [Dictyoglomus turgidum D
MKIPLAVILGPTGTGKTKLSLELAKYLPVEIVSVDSMQIYQGMDIGTAKPSLEDREKVPHHLIDIVLPDYFFTVAEFRERALKVIEEIYARRRFPLLVGGTPLYYKVLFGEFSIPHVPPDLEFRRKMKELAEKEGEYKLYEELKKIDPKTASKIHPRDLKRIIRALEVYYKVGKPISELAGEKKEDRFYISKIGLYMPRDLHYRILEERVDKMIEQGLVDEVRNLYLKGINENFVSMQGIGYKEILRYLRGELTLEESINLIKKRTKEFVKRQYTWFKKYKDIHWFDVSQYSLSQLAKLVYNTIINDWENQGYKYQNREGVNYFND